MSGCLHAAALAVALAAVLCDVGGGDSVQEKIQDTNSSEVLARALRRQLTKDNYDYESVESEHAQPRAASRRDGSAPSARAEELVTTVVDIGAKTERTKNITLSLKEKIKLKKKNERLQRHLYRKLARRRKKVQRYLYDIDIDMGKRYKARKRQEIPDDDNLLTDRDVEQATTVKYKLLKLRGPYRRSGHAPALILEQSAQGISIAKLGAGAFPEFRLPLPRRQYMNAPRTLRDDVEEDQELFPLPVSDK